jgi:hypothetical protein
MGKAHADVRRVRLAKGQPPRWPSLRLSARILRARGAALEARPGIEPGFTDLQSVTSPLRHRASIGGHPLAMVLGEGNLQR